MIPVFFGFVLLFAFLLFFMYVDLFGLDQLLCPLILSTFIRSAKNLEYWIWIIIWKECRPLFKFFQPFFFSSRIRTRNPAQLIAYKLTTRLRRWYSNILVSKCAFTCIRIYLTEYRYFISKIMNRNKLRPFNRRRTVVKRFNRTKRFNRRRTVAKRFKISKWN